MSSKRLILPPVYLAVCLVLMLALHWLWPGPAIIPKPFGYIGIVDFVAGSAVAVWGNWRFRQATMTIKPFQESSALVTDGLFRYSRNPAYLGMVVGLAGIAVLLGSLAPWLPVPVFAVVVDRKLIHHEEAMLRDRFGPAYEAYCRKVRRWI